MCSLYFFFFFNDTATTEIYTLSLHDALPISRARAPRCTPAGLACGSRMGRWLHDGDRKSTRLNSSHGYISYAVFCLKKKNSNTIIIVASLRVLFNARVSRYLTSFKLLYAHVC